MLYIVGLGLSDEHGITLRGIDAVKRCHKVYVEASTYLLSASDGLSRLEKACGKSVIVADREMVVEKADEILAEASEMDVAFLVAGDPFGAIYNVLGLRAKKLGLEVKLVLNASIMMAIGVCGLQLHRYGETISLPFFTETWRPDSFYPKIASNQKRGLHTLCLFDMRVKEPSLESGREKKTYEYMTINTAIKQLLEVEEKRGESAYNEDSKCVGFARLGNEDEVIVAGSMKDLLDVDFGAPLHCLVIAGDTNPSEEQLLKFYTIK